MADCLDYMNAGMEAIIEDEVTQRFVAEELKVWLNLIWQNSTHFSPNLFYFDSLGIYWHAQIAIMNLSVFA